MSGWCLVLWKPLGGAFVVKGQRIYGTSMEESKEGKLVSQVF